MMKVTKTIARLIGVSAMAAMLAGPAIASDEDDDDSERKVGFSFNIGGTSNYVFRGFSQSAKDPAFQAGVDLTFGMLYAGAWVSGIDFGQNTPGGDVANSEVDFIAGITPSLGPINFDLGVIYYVYPSAKDAGAELDYWEIKAGASTTLLQILGLSATAFYSPEYTGKGGEVWTLEGGASVDLPKIAFISPSISAVVGTTISDGDPQFVTAFNGKEYVYWNAGITLGIDKISIDLRYWGSDVSNVQGGVTGFCEGSTFQCDDQYSATVKFTF